MAFFIQSGNFFAKRLKFLPIGSLQVGHFDNLPSIIPWWHGWQTRWPLGHEGIGPSSGMDRHTGHLTMPLSSVISLSYLSAIFTLRN